MPLLTETYFLQNMGRVLLASLLQFSILYLVYIILKNTLLKKISARADYLVLLFALLLGTTLFVYGLVNSFSNDQPPATLSFIPQESGWYHLLNPVLHWLAMLYIVIGSLRTLVFLRHVLAPHKKQFHEPVQLAADFAEYLETFCAHIRLNMPRIVFSRKAVTPFVTG
ncbi:MAG: hypothetical protein JNM68_09095, partial [Dinghuibacter sp.]|nr:hypothetical protein [Dinghuibacter sp.]